MTNRPGYSKQELEAASRKAKAQAEQVFDLPEDESVTVPRNILEGLIIDAIVAAETYGPGVDRDDCLSNVEAAQWILDNQGGAS